MKMVVFERLEETARSLIAHLKDGGIAELDETLTASRTTAKTYRYTYDRYVQYFKERRNDTLTEQDLYVGFAFAYSWMATIKQLDPALATVRSAVSALNELHTMQVSDLSATVNQSPAADEDRIERLATMIEPIRHFLGSVIGTSKMLHFANPDVFPIWDAVIHRYCRLPEHTGAADSLRAYAQYTFMVHQLVNHAEYEARIYKPLLEAMEQAHSVLSDQYRAPEPMGKVRATEYVMFFGGKAESAGA